MLTALPRFPQLVLQVVVHAFPAEHPFAMHVFWMFNAANFAGDIRRGKDNHALLVALDPVRGEAAIIPSYGLDKIVLLVKPPLVESTVGFGPVDEVKISTTML